MSSIEKKCLGKRKYRSQRIATRQANRLSIPSHDLLAAYKCTYCVYWHIGRRFHLGLTDNVNGNNCSNMKIVEQLFSDLM